MNKSDFKENYHGILRHDGAVMVAKTNITAKIRYIGYDDVLVQSRKKSYVAQIHKNLHSSMRYVDEGDTAFIKFKNGTAWMVGYRKKNYDQTPTSKVNVEPDITNLDCFLVEE